MKKNMDKHFGPQHKRTTMMQSWIIGYVLLRQNEGLDTFQKDIEEEFSINRSTASEMLQLMDKRNLIVREPVDYDGRLKKIVLTEKSRDYHEWINQTMKQLNQELTEGLSSQEINEFMRITDIMIANLLKNDEKSEDLEEKK